MTKVRITIALTILFLRFGFAQENLGELLNAYNSESVPYISVQELAMPKTNAIILDAREYREYKVSHIKDAIHVGFNDFDIETLSPKLKNHQAVIVVYCSLGIRSEIIANKLKNKGYTHVFNLYGGIFEWKNNGFEVYDTNGTTDAVHVFSEAWSQWLLKGTKIYD